MRRRYKCCTKDIALIDFANGHAVLGGRAQGAWCIACMSATRNITQSVSDFVDGHSVLGRHTFEGADL